MQKNNYDIQNLDNKYSLPKAEHSVEAVLFQKAEILREKLQVLNEQKETRFSIRDASLKDLLDEEAKVNSLLIPFENPSSGVISETGFTNILHQKLFDIDRERRSTETECWRDISMITREILIVWEAYQNTKARAKLLNNVPKPEE